MSILVTNIQTSYDLAMRSVYNRCTYLKPLAEVKKGAATYLEVPMVEFVTPETPYGGVEGLCKGYKDHAWTDNRHGTVEDKWRYSTTGRVLIGYDKDPLKRQYAYNFEPRQLILTEGKALPGFTLQKGDWADFRYVKIKRAISPVQVHPARSVRKPLVIRDVPSDRIGDKLSTYALTTGRWFRAADGQLFFECTPIKNNDAFYYTITVASERIYVPTQGQGSRNDYEYQSGEVTQHFEVPDVLWFRACSAVLVEDVGDGDDLAALLDPAPRPSGGDSASEDLPGGDGKDGKDGGNTTTRTLLNALLLGLAVLGK